MCFAEVNTLDRHVNEPMIAEMFSIVGYNFTGHLNEKKKRKLKDHYKLEHINGFRPEYYATRTEDKQENIDIENNFDEELKGSNLRVVLRAEEELECCKHFVRLFPPANEDKYSIYFEEITKKNKLLLKWENKYSHQRSKGRKLLEELCLQNLHLNDLQTEQSVSTKPKKPLNSTSIRLHSYKNFQSSRNQ